MRWPPRTTAIITPVWSGGQRIHGPDLADVPKLLKTDSFAVAQQTEKMTTAAIASDVWSVSLTDRLSDTELKLNASTSVPAANAMRRPTHRAARSSGTHATPTPVRSELG